MAWNKKAEDRRKVQLISFSEEEGHLALEYLQSKKSEKGGMSAYITRLILEDKQRNERDARN